MKDAPVYVAQNGKVVATAKTNTKGQFTVPQVRPGTSVVAVADTRGVFRLWDGRIAPKNAKQGITVVTGDEVVRGQMFGGTVLGALAPAAAVAGVAAGVAIGVSQTSDPTPASP